MASETEIAGGGHPPALLIPLQGPTRYVEARGRPLGFPDAGSAGTTRLRLEPGDLLVLYTDGMVEAGRDIDEGFDTLRAAGEQLRDRPLEGVLEGMLDIVRAAAVLRDDALLLAVRRQATSGPAAGKRSSGTERG